VSERLPRDEHAKLDSRVGGNVVAGGCRELSGARTVCSWEQTPLAKVVCGDAAAARGRAALREGSCVGESVGAGASTNSVRRTTVTGRVCRGTSSGPRRASSSLSSGRF
jgi:hypothetical protein